MSMNITKLAVSQNLLTNVAYAGSEVVVRRFHHFDVPNPVKAEGITLVSFDGLLKDFSDYDQKSGSTGSVFDDLATHAKDTDIETTGAIAIYVYRLKKGDTIVTCNQYYKDNELMGMAYVSQDYLTQKFGKEFTIEDGVRLTMLIDQALRNLTQWQHDDIYNVVLTKADTSTLTSPLYYDVDRTEAIIIDMLNHSSSAA